MAWYGSGGSAVKRRMWSEYFNDELVAEILVRLPVKAILRFRLVCKAWRALIADSNFVKKQLSYAESGISNCNNSRLLILQNPLRSIDYEAVKERLNPDFAIRGLYFPVTLSSYRLEGKRSTVLGSCHGLICVKFKDVGIKDVGIIILWNPCMGVAKILPNPPADDSPMDKLHGFGYDSISDDNKLILGRMFYGKPSLIHVLSLKIGSWRTIRDVDSADIQGTRGKGCLFNGALHWVVHAGQSRIMSFSLAKEKFVSFSMPEKKLDKNVPGIDLDHYYIDGVLVYKDRLCVYQISDAYTWSGFVSIWSMEEYGAVESWIRVIEFTFKKGLGVELRPLCILQNGEILMHRVVDPDPEGGPAMEDRDTFVHPERYNEQQDRDVSYDVQVYDVDPVCEDPVDYDSDEWYSQAHMYNDDSDDYAFDMWYDRLCMPHATSLLIVKNEKTSKAVLEVEMGYGAAIYRESLVSPMNLVGQVENQDGT